ncbi:MAG: NADH-quinone oxidoreductase subunit C [Dehalococcoidia bacterium]
MTTWLSGNEMAERIRARFPDAVVRSSDVSVLVAPERLVEVGRFLRDDPDCAFEMATNVTAVDWEDHFEVVYHLQSIKLNQIMTLKVHAHDYDDPQTPSLTSVWYGAHLQEREVYDLFGIRFDGHPDLRRLFLWEGFAGWPLRKSFLQVAQGRLHPGLPHFPKEGGDRGLISGPRWSEQEAGWRPPPTPGIKPAEERRPGGHQQMGAVSP